MINPFRLVAHFRRIPRLLPAFLVFSFVASTVALQAEEVVIKANFSEGDSASAVDGYPGAAGEGWIDSWRITRPRGGETLFILKVLEEDPLPDQTHYLHLEAKEPQPFIFLERSLDRSSLDLSKAHTFRFTVRLDSLDPPDKKFRFNISAHEEGDTGIASSFWFVTSQEGFWYVLGKNEDESTKWWKSSVPLTLGTAYSFTVTVDPEAKTFQVKIRDGSNEVDSPVMFSHAENASDGAGGYSFGGGGQEQSSIAPFAWSLGAVEISGTK